MYYFIYQTNRADSKDKNNMENDEIYAGVIKTISITMYLRRI